MAGKGDKYRPVNKAKYDQEYDRIFRQSKEAALAPKGKAKEQVRKEK